MLTARPLSIWDAAFCWRLAHDPDVRASAIDRTPPTVLGHLRWMAIWLFKRDRQAWVIWWDFEATYGVGEVLDLIPFLKTGLARVDRAGTVSIEVLPDFRGLGVGLFGVRIATDFAEAHGWATPTAYIRADNGPSIGLFAKAGYEMAGAVDGWVTMERRGA